MVNVVWAQWERYGKGFDATVSYLGHIFTKKGYVMEYIHITKTGSQPAKSRVIAFMWMIVWGSMEFHVERKANAG